MTNPLEDGHLLALVERGEGEPVVLLHGSPGSAASWDGVVEILVRDFLLLVPDLIGFGASSRCRHTHHLVAAAQAQAVATALDDTAVRDATVVGHDLGGAVAARLARLRPDLVARLALVAPRTGPDPALSGWLLGRRGLRRVSGVADVGDRRQAAAVRRLARTDPAPEFAADIDGLDLPAVVVWGTADDLTPSSTGRGLVAALLRAHLVLVEGAGHQLPTDAPAEVAHAVRDLVTTPRGG